VSAAHSLPWRTAAELVSDDERAVLWRAGQLFWLLHGDQADCYRRYRAWDEHADTDTEGLYRRIFVFDCARRYGKDWLCLCIKLEDAIRRPGSIHTYATAFAKDIAEIVVPLMDDLLAHDCPDEIRPEHKTTRMGETAGYYFPNGSIIKLVGIDKNPNGLRGRGSDGGVVTEAAFVKQLEKAALSVIYPQFQGRPWARLILQSTAPDTRHHAYDKTFIPDAKVRGAYVFRTIDDNPLLDETEREHFIAAAGGRDHPTAQREYFGLRVREEKTKLVPEFSITKHVVDHIPSPEWGDTYVGGDPGMRDLFGMVWGYWDPERAKLRVQLSWAKRNAGTRTVAVVMRGSEVALWGGAVPNEWGDDELDIYAEAMQVTRPGSWTEVVGMATQWWDDTAIRTAPYMRVSDTDVRLLADLSQDHGIEVSPADKTGTAEASLYNLRDWFANDRIEIDEIGGALLIEHLTEGEWNPNRTDYLRSESYGHFDLIDALRYLVRHVDRERIARPPDHILDPTLQRAILHDRSSATAQALNATLTRRNRWQR